MVVHNNKDRGFADELIGCNWGDEGKAKIIDLIAHGYDIVVRFNGGSNAGHSVETDQHKLTLHQVPSAVTHPTLRMYIGSGCVVNPVKLIEEIEGLERVGLNVRERLLISPKASLVQPHQILIDRIGSSDVGTTNNGIGPAYADRARRMYKGHLVHSRTADLISSVDQVVERARHNLEVASKEFEIEGLPEDLIPKFKAACTQLVALIARDPFYLVSEVEKGARVLFEGAQSTELDVSRGTVPYVTSSSTVAAAAYVGGDLPSRYHRKTIGVAKLLMSRVGKGPFPSEFGGSRSEEYCMTDNGARHNRDYEKRTYDPEALLREEDPFKLGIGLRMISNEYGSTTGRPRRVGALDLAQIKAAVIDNGVDDLYLTKADLLQLFSKTQSGTMPIITGYELDGDRTYPVSLDDFKQLRLKPENWTPFKNSIEGVTDFNALPAEVKELIERIENATGARVAGIGTGPKRDHIVLR